MLMGVSTVSKAQDGTAADIALVKNLLASKPADLSKQLNTFYKKNKKNVPNLLAFGRECLNAEVFDEANKFAEYALAADKKSAAAFILLGDIAAVKEEDGGKAASNYEQAIYFDPENIDAYRKYANVYRKVDLNGAIAKLEELHSKKPEVAVDGMIGHLYYQSLKYSSAKDAYNKLKLPDYSRRDFVEHSYSLFKCKEYEDALRIIDAGLNKNPLNGTLTRLGLFCATELGKGSVARNYADVLFNKVSRDSITISGKDYLYYGRAFTVDSMFQQAVKQYQAGLDMNSDNKEDRQLMLKNISDAYKGMGNYPEAIKAYENYLAELENADVNDFAGTGQLWMQYARTFSEGSAEQKDANKKADEVFAQLIEKYPSQASLEYGYFQRARLNSLIDDDKQSQGLAKPHYEKLIELITTREPDTSKLTATDKRRLFSAYRFLMATYVNSKQVDVALPYAIKAREVAAPENYDAINEIVKKLGGQ